MNNPRKGRVEERHFLNLPGYHAGAYVIAYIQDTSDHQVTMPTAERPDIGDAPGPHMLLEISDCSDRVRIWFDLEDADDRMNSFHKINTLIASLEAFQTGMQAEADLRRRRVEAIERARAELRGSAPADFGEAAPQAA